MKRLFLQLCAALIFCSAQASAAGDLPAPVRKGLQIYSQEGTEQAVIAWLKNSPLERSSEINKLVKMLNSIERMCGKYQDYQVARVHHFTSSVRFAYVQLNYTSCPIFGRFVAYEGDSGWLITQLNFNAKPEKVLPPSMLVQ